MRGLVDAQYVFYVCFFVMGKNCLERDDKEKSV